jgi:hypothetical protein
MITFLLIDLLVIFLLIAVYFYMANKHPEKLEEFMSKFKK